MDPGLAQPIMQRRRRRPGPSERDRDTWPRGDDAGTASAIPCLQSTARQTVMVVVVHVSKLTVSL
jgi:hypothetical protein